MPEPAIDSELLATGGVQVSVTEGRATITLNRPDVLNAQTPLMWSALRAIGSSLGDDVRVVVLRGAGRAFSAGLNRQMFTPAGVNGEASLVSLATQPRDRIDTSITEFQRAFTWLRDPRWVSVAAVHGHAIGAGFQLALGCDLRVIAEDTQFAMAETNLGLVPDLGGTLPLVQCVGYSRAVEICVTGRRIGAEEALRIGLANRVVPGAELDAAVDELAEQLTRPLPDAVRDTVALLRAAATQPDLADQLAAERAAQIRRLTALAAAMAAPTSER